ncbi:MAG: hypothetical protein M3R55_10610 [Acidobacteriota bacterium]|nr:hypothetical protein [Acidobacteriota bacterium]
MRTRFVVAALVAALGATSAFAASEQQTGGNPARTGNVGGTGSPMAPAVPDGELMLGTVRIRMATMADGKALPAGTYMVKLTPAEATPAVVGQTRPYERWVEFSSGGTVRGREVVSIVPAAEIAGVANDPAPRRNASKVEMLRNNEFVRVWINREGNHYLVHLVPTNQGKGN